MLGTPTSWSSSPNGTPDMNGKKRSEKPGHAASTKGGGKRSAALVQEWGEPEVDELQPRKLFKSSYIKLSSSPMVSGRFFLR